jgi:hypothetical protein
MTGGAGSGSGFGPTGLACLLMGPLVLAVLVMAWWGFPALLAVPFGTVGSLVMVVLLRVRAGRRPAVGRPVWDRVSKAAVWWWVLGYATAAVALIALTPPLLNAWALTHPVRTTAVAAGTDVPCRRCSTRATVVFLAQGRLVRTGLRAPFQGDGYYRAGIPVVYERDHPAKAMAVPDRAFGRGPVPMAGLLVGALALVLAVRNAERSARR